MLDALDADSVRRWSRAALLALRAHQTEIDALNVFPVPDGDTGTNLMLTMLVADDAVQSAGDATAGDALATLARSSVLGARGNSGVIASQLFRGLAEAARGTETVDAGTFCHGLALGSSFAVDAVATPVEGTILSVARAAAEGVPGTASATLVECLKAAVAAARAALARTTEQLPALAEAGVVDAGGSGFVVLLEALLAVVTDDEREPAADIAARPEIPAAATAAREAGSPDFAFEVQYLLDGPEHAIAELRAQLVRLGDSVAVVGTGDGTWNVHVHVNDVDAAVAAGKAAGRAYRLSVVRFVDQLGPAAPRPIGVVAVGIDHGMHDLFAREGVQVVATTLPSSDEVLAAVRSAGDSDVVVLANGVASASAAEAAASAARDSGVRVAVVPTRSPVQALASVAVHDPARRFDDDVVAMAEAAAATRFAEVSVAQEQSLTSVGICEAGDILGLIDGEVVEIGHGLVSVALALTDRLLGVGAELLTVVPGPDAPSSMGELMRSHVRARAPFTEVVVYPAGADAPPLVIGVE